MKRSSVKFDISVYTIEFKSIFLYKDIQQQFVEFLETEYNQEPFFAVLEINELNELTESESIIKKCKEIVKKYLTIGSDFEVNISQETKDNLMSSLKKQLEEKEWILEETAYEIFYPLKRILLLELCADNWPRFVRSKNFIKMIEKYSENTKVMKVITALKYPFKDEHYEKPFVTTSEMSFLNELLAESFAWEPIYRKKHFSVYQTQMRFLPESKYFSHAKSLKLHATLPFSFEKVIRFFLSMDYFKFSDPSVTNIDIRENLKIVDLGKKYPEDSIANQVYSIIGEVCVQPPFPVHTSRKSIDCFCISFDNETQTFTFVRRPYLGDYKGQDIDWTKKLGFDFIDKSNVKKNVEGYILAVMNMVKLEIINSEITRMSLLTSLIFQLFINYLLFSGRSKRLFTIRFCDSNRC